MTALTDRIRTSPRPGGVLVEVLTPDGAVKVTYATVRRLSAAGLFRWRVSNGLGGDAPLYVGAVLASAHAIDESEAAL